MSKPPTSALSGRESMACLYSEFSTLPAQCQHFTHALHRGGLNQISASSQLLKRCHSQPSSLRKALPDLGAGTLQPPNMCHIFSPSSDRLWVVCSLIKMRVIGPSKQSAHQPAHCVHNEAPWFFLSHLISLSLVLWLLTVSPNPQALVLP